MLAHFCEMENSVKIFELAIGLQSPQHIKEVNFQL